MPEITVGSLWDMPGVASHIEGYWSNPGEVAMRQEVSDWVGPQRNRLLLDVGCGTARMSSLLQDCRYLGMDGSREMLKLARNRAPHALFIQGNLLANSWPYVDKAYDAALCMHVVRHLPEYGKLLTELARTVREQVFVVDVFRMEGGHRFGTSDVANQMFLENSWSLPLFLDDVAAAFPGWQVAVEMLTGVVGVRIGGHV